MDKQWVGSLEEILGIQWVSSGVCNGDVLLKHDNIDGHIYGSATIPFAETNQQGQPT